MGWHIGMTEEEMKEFAGMSCPISKEEENSFKTVAIADNSKTTTTAALPNEIGTTASLTSQVSSSNKKKGKTACPLPTSSLPPPPPPEVEFIYHLCQQSKWDQAVNKKLPYFPPTYMKDGKFTRASVDKEDMMSVANHYYKETPGKWIVLEIDCKMLYSLGIPILAQEAPESVLEAPVKCLQIYGGISTSLPVVHRVYPVFRNRLDGEFLKLLEPGPSMTAMSPTLVDTGKGRTTNTKPEVSQEQLRSKKGILAWLKKR
jgi:hypothetical protein